MAVIAEAQQLEKKSGEKITKIHLGGFCDWKKKAKEEMKKQGKTSRADEGDKPLKDCLIPRIVQKLLIWAFSKLHGPRQENIKIQ